MKWLFFFEMLTIPIQISLFESGYILTRLLSGIKPLFLGQHYTQNFYWKYSELSMILTSTGNQSRKKGSIGKTMHSLMQISYF